MQRTLGAALLALTTAHLATAAQADVTPLSTVSAIAGHGTAGFSGDGGPASAALLDLPRDTAVGPDGTLYVTDTDNNRIRRIDLDGDISTVAGTGSPTFNGDGLAATEASLHWPHDVEVAPDGTVYIADSAHHRIRAVDANGTISTVAGTGVMGSTGDGGPATLARLKNPKTVVHHDGWLYTAGLDNKVRRISLTSGIIERVAGTGAKGYSGDGGPALRATLKQPQRVQVDSAGNVYVADTGNNRIRRIDAVTRVITTVAGTGVKGYSGDGGLAVRARLASPRGIALGDDVHLYIADYDNHKVRMVDLVTGVIVRVAGTTQGYGGDGGPAGSATFYQPRGLTALPNGDLVVADTGNSAIRLISSADQVG